MTRRIIMTAVAVALCLVALPALAQINIDYDQDADLESYETWAYMDSDHNELRQTNPLVHKRVVEAIKNQLNDAGDTEDAENPDLIVTYHVTTEENQRAFTTGTGWDGYGYPGGWGGGYYYRGYGGGWGMSSSTTTVTTYTTGTIIIDFYDTETKELVWRGVITQAVSDKSDKNIKRLEKNLRKLAKKWDKMNG